ncbi:MAG: hypothetical protein ACOX5G_01385 [Kiritimatiellia bacterium]|jgi:hypothetical protein
MRKTLLLLCASLAFSLVGLANDDALLKALAAGDRTARKNAAMQIEQRSVKDLLALAEESIKSESLEPSAAIYVFHQILCVASEKGFTVHDAAALIRMPGASEFRQALIDWIREFGTKRINSDDAAGMLPEIDAYFQSKQETLRFRTTAHKLSRDLAWKIRVDLNEKENMQPDQREKMKQLLCGHIDHVCQVVADSTEADEAVEVFAGCVPYYRLYAREGLYQDGDLQDALQQAANQRNRSPKTKKAIQAMIAELWKAE